MSKKKEYTLKESFDTPFLHVMIERLNRLEAAKRSFRLKMMSKLPNFDEALSFERKIFDNKGKENPLTKKENEILNDFYSSLEVEAAMSNDYNRIVEKYNEVLYTGNDPLYTKILKASFEINDQEISDLSGTEIKGLLDTVFLELGV